ncbi:peptidase M50 [Mycobacteriaceae bacterium 1482268.1]|nr:peptidase M50 [Mycobacteriaceae bacterium 1482268.1]
MITANVVVLLFGGRRLPRPLAGLATQEAAGQDDIDAAAERCGRLIVVGSDADLAAVLTRLLRTDRLDVEVGHASGWRAARRARRGTPRRVPLIRDDAGHVIVGAAEWRGRENAPLHGEAVVDDIQLFDGDVAGVRIEPTHAMPGLRAAVIRGPRRRWVVGRAAQLGTTGAVVVRDGVAGDRVVRRSTFYRHTQGWLLVK